MSGIENRGCRPSVEHLKKAASCVGESVNEQAHVIFNKIDKDQRYETQIRPKVEEVVVGAKQKLESVKSIQLVPQHIGEKARDISRKIDENSRLNNLFRPQFEEAAGYIIDKFTSAEKINIHDPNSALKDARKHLENGSLIIGDPFHEDIYQGLRTMLAIKKMFSDLKPEYVMPFSYKFWWDSLLPDKHPFLVRRCVEGFQITNRIKAVRIYQPKHVNNLRGQLTSDVKEKILRDQDDSKKYILGELKKVKTIVPIYIRGTRSQNPYMEPTEKTGNIFLFRNNKAALLPMTTRVSFSILRGRKLDIYIGPLITHNDIVDFQKNYEWTDEMVNKLNEMNELKLSSNRIDKRLTKYVAGIFKKTNNYIDSDHAIMYLVSEALKHMPPIEPDINPRGIYVPENIKPKQKQPQPVA